MRVDRGRRGSLCRVDVFDDRVFMAGAFELEVDFCGDDQCSRGLVFRCCEVSGGDVECAVFLEFLRFELGTDVIASGELVFCVAQRLGVERADHGFLCYAINNVRVGVFIVVHRGMPFRCIDI